MKTPATAKNKRQWL